MFFRTSVLSILPLNYSKEFRYYSDEHIAPTGSSCLLLLLIITVMTDFIRISEFPPALEPTRIENVKPLDGMFMDHPHQMSEDILSPLL